MLAEELKEYLYNNKKIEYVLEKLGCKNIKYNANKDYYSASFPDGDNPSGIIINNNKYLNFYSFSRGSNFNENSDIIVLVEYINKTNFINAIKYLHNLFGLQYDFNKKELKKETEDPLKLFKEIRSHTKKRCVDVNDIQYIKENMLDDYIPLLHINWLKEGITESTKKKFGICYSYTRKRQCIPIRFWKDGSLVGMNQRTMIDNYNEFGIKKYFLTPSYQKGLNLYGLWENRESIEKKGCVVVVEAEKSVLKRDSLMDDSLVALQGHSISDEQLRIICSLDINEVVIAMDKDIKEEEIWYLCSKFYRIKKVSYIYDKWGLLDEKDSPVDKGNKIYQFLFKYRFTYDDNTHKKYLNSLKKS